MRCAEHERQPERDQREQRGRREDLRRHPEEEEQIGGEQSHERDR